MVIVTTDKTSKFDQLHSVRYKLEHNQLSRLKPESDKINVFQTLDKHIKCSKDWEVKQFAVQLIHVSAHHMFFTNPETTNPEFVSQNLLFIIICSVRKGSLISESTFV